LSECNTSTKAVFIDRHPEDPGAHHDLIEKFESIDDLSEDRITAIEMGRR